MVSGARDETLRLWDVNGMSAVGEPLHGHETAVTGGVLNMGTQLVVSGSIYKTVRVWDFHTNTHQHSEKRRSVRGPLEEHTGWMNVAISSGGRMVLSNSNGTLQVWDVESGMAVGEPPRGHELGVSSVAISGDGRTVVSRSHDCTLRVWDVESGRAIGEPLPDFEGWVHIHSVAISTDGRTVVSGSSDHNGVDSKRISASVGLLL